MEQTEIPSLDLALDPALDPPAEADVESISTSPAVQQDAHTPVLITEQRVKFGSAAALAPAPTRPWNPAHALAAAVRAMFTRPEKPRARRHYPSRPEFMEHAAMRREMGRL